MCACVCVCACVSVEAGIQPQAFSRRHSATSSEREGAKKCGGVRAATGSEREGAKMCGGGRAGWIQFISLHGDGALTNGQGQTIPRGKIQNLFHAICGSCALATLPAEGAKLPSCQLRVPTYAHTRFCVDSEHMANNFCDDGILIYNSRATTCK